MLTIVRQDIVHGMVECYVMWYDGLLSRIVVYDIEEFDTSRWGAVS